MNDSESSPAPRGRPFQPGQSGNPKGRPKGSRNAVTLLAEALLNDEAEAIIRKVVEKALEGDSAAMRLAIERMIRQSDSGRPPSISKARSTPPLMQPEPPARSSPHA